MKNKLNCVLLIDDDAATNFLHERIIISKDFTEKVVAMESGLEALNFLQTKKDGNYPEPDLIFLDINMPAMNGWEFLEKYDKLDPEKQGNVVVVMLTTSLNLDDKQRAVASGRVTQFRNKPLTSSMLDEILLEHFPNRF